MVEMTCKNCKWYNKGSRCCACDDCQHHPKLADHFELKEQPLFKGNNFSFSFGYGGIIITHHDSNQFFVMQDEVDIHANKKAIAEYKRRNKK